MVIPSFKLLLVDSINYFDTRDIAKGKPFVIFYYRSNCPYSRALMDEIIKNMASFKNYQFIIATRSPFNQMKSFYTHFKLNKYKNFIAGLDIENVVPEYYNVKGVPFTAIFDNDKKLVCSFTGRIDGKVILNSINPYK
ncbi:hypothetical protein A4H97_32010 [Niastella yeongjuensis]|uniref:Alkyl hydroperoxide reductase subunit C/ Thiol specific antioxidant domain-containing protein n=2 Tax=Niastella yeongjuensis TaxID=354355 RepID=A0A1V9EIA9_9BACT|nr:hypothetical protein A4H97_32010 [Niastella yeongjuensis]SEP46707.1 AhpC/TSA family protein [Niastella yeongjuensis]